MTKLNNFSFFFIFIFPAILLFKSYLRNKCCLYDLVGKTGNPFWQTEITLLQKFLHVCLIISIPTVFLVTLGMGLHREAFFCDSKNKTTKCNPIAYYFHQSLICLLSGEIKQCVLWQGHWLHHTYILAVGQDGKGLIWSIVLNKNCFFFFKLIFYDIFHP